MASLWLSSHRASWGDPSFPATGKAGAGEAQGSGWYDLDFHGSTASRISLVGFAVPLVCRAVTNFTKCSGEHDGKQEKWRDAAVQTERGDRLGKGWMDVCPEGRVSQTCSAVHELHWSVVFSVKSHLLIHWVWQEHQGQQFFKLSLCKFHGKIQWTFPCLVRHSRSLGSRVVFQKNIELNLSCLQGVDKREIKTPKNLTVQLQLPELPFLTVAVSATFC